jgi:hypothetical protein
MYVAYTFIIYLSFNKWEKSLVDTSEAKAIFTLTVLLFK